MGKRVVDIPKNLEIWIGNPHGLRLKKHPRLEEAKKYLDEYPLVCRKGQIIDRSSLSRGADFVVKATSIPAFRRSSVGLTIELRLEVDLPPAEQKDYFAKLKVSTPEAELEEYLYLFSGKRQVITFPFPYFDKQVDLTVDMQFRDGGKTRHCFSLEPEKKLTFFATFQTHLDLGWTGCPEEVIASLKKMTANVAIGVCKQFANNPEGERFVWTCECSEALRFAWEGSGEKKRKILKKCIEEQLIQSCCLPYTFHSSIMSKDLMLRSIEQSFKLRKEIGVENFLDLSVAQQNDVPGHNWVFPDILAEKGITRCILGHNHGVRGCTLPPLFRWRGPGGGEVLTLTSTCYDYGGSAPVPQSPADLSGLSVNNPDGMKLEGTGLFVGIGYGENCGPENAAKEMDSIKSWNANFAWPRIQVGGPKDYFEHLEREINQDKLPLVDKEISDWWVDGPASTPRAMAEYRKSMILLPLLEKQVKQAETSEIISEIEKNLILHAEHTFGLNAQLVKVRASQNNWDIPSSLEKDHVKSWEDKEEYAAKASAGIKKLKELVPFGKKTKTLSSHSWQIDYDKSGISNLISPQGTKWLQKEEDNPPFASVVQRLMPEDTGDWFHHNPPSAPNAGDRWMQITSVETLKSGVKIKGALSSPAGRIPEIIVEIKNDETTEDLLIDLNIKNKEATLQAEVLGLFLPFSLKNPDFKIDVAGSLQTIDTEQLPDANRDEHAVLNGWTVNNNNGKTLAVSSAEVFLWHFGELRYCNFNRLNIPRNGHVYAHLFNNLWETTFRCFIEGDLFYRIRLRDITGLNPALELENLSNLWSC